MNQCYHGVALAERRSATSRERVASPGNGEVGLGDKKASPRHRRRRKDAFLGVINKSRNLKKKLLHNRRSHTRSTQTTLGLRHDIKLKKPSCFNFGVAASSIIGLLLLAASTSPLLVGSAPCFRKVKRQDLRQFSSLAVRTYRM